MNLRFKIHSISLNSFVNSVLHVRMSDNQDNSQIMDENQTNDEEVGNIMSQSQSNDVPIASYGSSSSNNVLNMNLSGSMQRFNRHRRATNADISDNDDDGNNGSLYHECYEPNQSIFAPISMSQPIMNPSDHQVSTTQSNAVPSVSHQRIAVAALPNLEYDAFTRGYSVSSPSLYSQPESSSRRNSDGSDQRRTDFARNSAASSSNYFV